MAPPSSLPAPAGSSCLPVVVACGEHVRGGILDGGELRALAFAAFAVGSCVWWSRTASSLAPSSDSSCLSVAVAAGGLVRRGFFGGGEIRDLVLVAFDDDSGKSWSCIGFSFAVPSCAAGVASGDHVRGGILDGGELWALAFAAFRGGSCVWGSCSASSLIPPSDSSCDLIR